MKRYLFFLAHSYSYDILRPLQDEINRRGDEVAWWLEPTCPDMLAEGEKRLATKREVKDWNPVAVFAPGNYVQPWMPGVKVCVFHGYYVNKRPDRPSNHFRIRGWFDVYCTHGPSTTGKFKELERKHGYFKVYETGWCRDDRLANLPRATGNKRPLIRYASTFTPSLSSVRQMLPVIDNLASEKPWDWLIAFHPLITDPEIIESYRQLERRHPNVDFRAADTGTQLLARADAMLCDSSSIIVQHLMLDRPAVTFRNSAPGPHLINVTEPGDVGPALERALSRPPELMAEIRKYCDSQDPHRDGRNSARTLDAVDDFVANHAGKLKPKPLNLARKLKLLLNR